ncbi:acyl-CoA thioester hydrolase/BAAT C-terminal domain-containing protein [endosymbiont 'TC1' of Trimyema compressum]|uniref:acyl-CoA thioester hydrolase/BAAT C-terminal domain-containing protein n=1 Tax=endosymbiont 'TC1' of Trimyema compressum TaxID=243899 RepID=UPI001FE2013B|nr:acyl-CoA thioester hydrolase/BAAT C-terminal domain-containing protein [endosymbiont 'TC1' of Trimyema compressum]
MKKDYIREMYQNMIKKFIIEGASIEVENINGSILFLSSEEGKIWPSFLHCEIATKRLSEKNLSIIINIVLIKKLDICLHYLINLLSMIKNAMDFCRNGIRHAMIVGIKQLIF